MKIWLVYYLDCERGRALWEVMPSPMIFTDQHEAEMMFLELAEKHDLEVMDSDLGQTGEDADGIVFAVYEERNIEC